MFSSVRIWVIEFTNGNFSTNFSVEPKIYYTGTSPFVNLEKLKINKPVFIAFNRKKSLTSQYIKICDSFSDYVVVKWNYLLYLLRTQKFQSPFLKTSATSVEPKQIILCTESSFLGLFFLPDNSPGFHDPSYSPTRIHVVKWKKIWRYAFFHFCLRQKCKLTQADSKPTLIGWTAAARDMWPISSFHFWLCHLINPRIHYMCSTHPLGGICNQTKSVSKSSTPSM